MYRPRIITAITTLTILASIIIGFSGVALILASLKMDEHAYKAAGTLLVQGCIFFIVGVGGCLIAYQTYNMKRWAYWITFVFQLGTGIGCGYIFLPNVRSFIAGLTRFYGISSLLAYLVMIGTFMCPAIAIYMLFRNMRSYYSKSRSIHKMD